MNICGEMVIGGRCIAGSGTAFYAQNPASGETLEPSFACANEDNVREACSLASVAFDEYRNIPLEQRACFLECIAEEILALGDALVDRAVAESGLPRIRIEGERGRTVGQLRLFASVVRAGHWVDARIDPALPDRTPLPRSDIRLRHIPLGPVAVFGASNFPLAFSVAGGDTASALAAGCPVVVKAHPAHPGTSELVAKAIHCAASRSNIPAGVFSLLFDSGIEIGKALVADAAIKAVGFTGSRAAGLALMNVAARRSEPIPVYAEMSSINPVFLLPNALENSGEELASGFVSSLTLGAGQFCTNPGLVVGLASEALNEFISAASADLSGVPAQTMLTEGIHRAYENSVANMVGNPAVELLSQGAEADSPNGCQANLFMSTAKQFLEDASMQDEVFGAASLVVQCESTEELVAVAESLEGQLTATLQLHDDDTDIARKLLTVLERKVGRVLCNGYPTGVEVCHAMVHGGPFPATSDSRTTSVGSAAIYRFLRPVSYQDMPASLLSAELRDGNTGLRRLVDGSY
ncbi:aldehyde dehydrogenase (NADP(+)) [Halioglobus maricola]|uniref:Aldehyde dehydrogenase (NADP(+)) n=1 Tax=Halioglobus maricola TaxID=2601894 RepID=A0A5P9NKL6_9GAMM|nr:aldehyde dehydrogenase (NADP(+)) [Halioglobus maricola]QFU76317.1 aldehyde dehydrogenase (NADP(+)) [Halioglobus maricola]